VVSRMFSPSIKLGLEKKEVSDWEKEVSSASFS